MYKIYSKNISLQLLLYIELYLCSRIFYWRELGCKLLQDYLKAGINKRSKKKNFYSSEQ